MHTLLAILLATTVTPVALTNGSSSVVVPVATLADGGYALVVMDNLSAGSSTFDGILRDGSGAGQADVIGIAPTTEQGLVTRNIPSGTQAVSGTFWQGTQPVSIASMPSTPVTGTFWQATQPVSGTFWQATQPVSAASLPLPTGASTEATLAALPLAQASTTSGQKGPLVQCAVTTSAPAYTTAQTDPLSCDVTGNLRVGASQVGTWTMQPGNTANTTAWLQNVGQWGGTNVSAATAGIPDVNLKNVGNVAISTGYGVSGTGVARMAPVRELTYAASTANQTLSAAGTAVLANICGSDTVITKVKRIEFYCTVATTTVTTSWALTKTSAATTAGTATTLTNVPYNSSSAAATAVAKFYTALGTAGAAVGKIRSGWMLLPVTGTTAAIQNIPSVMDWTALDTQEPPTLRTSAQCLELSFTTTTTGAPTCTYNVTWTEGTSAANP